MMDLPLGLTITHPILDTNVSVYLRTIDKIFSYMTDMDYVIQIRLIFNPLYAQRTRYIAEKLKTRMHSSRMRTVRT